MLNKKILLSVFILGMVATVTSAGTYAFFTDAASTADNSVTAGDLKFNDGIASVALSATDAKPSAAVVPFVQPFSITNAGSISGALTASASGIAGDNIKNYMSVYITTKNGGVRTLIIDGVAQPAVDLGTFAAGDTYQPVVSYVFKDTGVAQDEAQDQEFKFKIDFAFKQV